MKHSRTIGWLAILIAPLIWIGTGNADTTHHLTPQAVDTVPATQPPTTTVPATSTSSSSTTTSTTTTVPAGDWHCPEWIPVLLYAGFPETELATADRIIYRESTCRPDAINSGDPNGGSHGLFQINGIWLNWFLPDRGIAWSPDDLYDPVRNAAAAYAIWERSGWHPWSTY